jgi:hypothetical protein
MNDLLSMDLEFVSNAVCTERDHAYTQQMIRIHVFVKGDYTSSNRKRGDTRTPTKINASRPERVHYHYCPIDAEAQVKDQLKTAVGRTVIAGKWLCLVS